ncbi:unnamed protein product [Moneuplotes crassus]|uniref:Uncharacterized protein n=1 Tax=Euplotes crassus TaxID=5936 RepID=A0AAD1X263_EUPCR|nr:unnamed protein product [Moneuplotes crassus]
MEGPISDLQLDIDDFSSDDDFPQIISDAPLRNLPPHLNLQRNISEPTAPMMDHFNTNRRKDFQSNKDKIQFMIDYQNQLNSENLRAHNIKQAIQKQNEVLLSNPNFKKLKKPNLKLETSVVLKKFGLVNNANIQKRRRSQDGVIAEKKNKPLDFNDMFNLKQKLIGRNVMSPKNEIEDNQKTFDEARNRGALSPTLPLGKNLSKFHKRHVKEKGNIDQLKNDMFILSSEFKEGAFQTDYIRKKIAGNKKREKFRKRNKIKSSEVSLTSTNLGNRLKNKNLFVQMPHQSNKSMRENNSPLSDRENIHHQRSQNAPSKGMNVSESRKLPAGRLDYYGTLQYPLSAHNINTISSGKTQNSFQLYESEVELELNKDIRNLTPSPQLSERSKGPLKKRMETNKKCVYIFNIFDLCKKVRSMIKKYILRYNKKLEKIESDQISQARLRDRKIFDEAREELEMKRSFLEKVQASSKAYCEKKKNSNNDNINCRNLSNMRSNKLTKDDIKFIDKQLLTLNEYPLEFKDIIYLFERGVEKIGREDDRKINILKNSMFIAGSKLPRKMKKKLSSTSHVTKKKKSIQKPRIKRNKSRKKHKDLSFKDKKLNLEKPQSIFNTKSSNLSSNNESTRYVDYHITIQKDENEESKNEQEQGNCINSKRNQGSNLFDDSDLHLSEQRSCSSQSTVENKPINPINFNQNFDPVSMKDIKRLSEHSNKTKGSNSRVLGAGFKLSYKPKNINKIRSNIVSPESNRNSQLTDQNTIENSRPSFVNYSEAKSFSPEKRVKEIKKINQKKSRSPYHSNGLLMKERSVRSPKKGVSRKKNSKKNVRFNKIENSKKNMVNPHREKLSKDMINKKDLIHRIRKGVLSPGKMGIFQTRYKSPQIKDINYITMPNFKVDRGRRKISKMGGLQTMFQFDNSNQGSSTRVPQNLHLNRTLNKQRDTRRLTNFGPSPTRKMVINHPILKKQTMNTELLKNLDNERNPHSNPNTFFEVIPEESQNKKSAKKNKHCNPSNYS